jgi:hypothetical protein
MSEYQEKLQDPRWLHCAEEHKRHAEFRCSKCGRRGGNLQVHHDYYESGVEPWEYPAWSLRVLCERCHAREQAKLVKAHKLVARLGLDKAIAVLEKHYDWRKEQLSAEVDAVLMKIAEENAKQDEKEGAEDRRAGPPTEEEHQEALSRRAWPVTGELQYERFMRRCERWSAGRKSATSRRSEGRFQGCGGSGSFGGLSSRRVSNSASTHVRCDVTLPSLASAH